MKIETREKIEQTTGLKLSHKPNTKDTWEVYMKTSTSPLIYSNNMELSITEYISFMGEVMYSIKYLKYIPSKFNGVISYPKRAKIKGIDNLIKHLPKLRNALASHQAWHTENKKISENQHQILKKIYNNKPVEQDTVYELYQPYTPLDQKIKVDIAQAMDYINELGDPKYGGNMVYGSFECALQDLKGTQHFKYIADHNNRKEHAKKLYDYYREKNGATNTSNIADKVCLFDGRALFCFKDWGEMLAYCINYITGGMVNSKVI